jgi:hypothetical protein
MHPTHESALDSLTAAQRRIVERLVHGAHVSRDVNREFRDGRIFGQWLADRIACPCSPRCAGAVPPVTRRAVGPIFRGPISRFSLSDTRAPRPTCAVEAFHPDAGDPQWHRASGICWIGWR